MENLAGYSGYRNGNNGFVILFSFLAALLFPRATFSPYPDSDVGDRDAPDKFYELLLYGVYVDKSLMIEEFVTGPGEVILITRPKGWGKSTNMKMLQRFLEIELDDEGEILPAEDRNNTKYFTGGAIYLGPAGRFAPLKRLKIAERDHIMKLHGRYPVIYLTFKDIAGTSYRHIANRTRNMMAILFRDHYFLKKKLKPDDDQIYESYRKMRANEKDLEYGLKILSRFVCKHYKEDVYVFIDDYDAPLTDLFLVLVEQLKNTFPEMSDEEIQAKAVQSPEYKNTFLLLQGILNNCFKTNDALRKGFLTGVFDIQLPNLIERFDNVLRYDLLTERYSEFYGFTKNEVDRMLKGTLYKKDDTVIKRWYGYHFTKNDTYNPWSMGRFAVNKLIYEPYWSRCSEKSLADCLLRSDRLQPLVHELVDGEIFGVQIRNETSFGRSRNDLNVFFRSGYLNPVAYNRSSKIWKLSVANEEIKTSLKNKIIGWACRKMNANPSNFTLMADSLTAFEVANFEKRLLTHLSVAPAVDNDAEKAGVFFSAISRGLAYSFGNEYIAHGYKIPECDRVIMLVAPRRGLARRAFVIEGIVSKCPYDLKEQADAALKQFHPMFDDIIGRKPVVNEALKLVLVFYGNDFGIAHKVELF